MRLYNTPSGAPPESETPVQAASVDSGGKRPWNKRIGNWWHYHWVRVMIILAVSAMAASLIASAVTAHLEPEPDLQIAYVGSVQLTDETVSALESAFEELTGDFNGDGYAVVQVNQYLSERSDDGLISYDSSVWVMLLSDINACDSYLFLMDDPETFQSMIQILAAEDGNEPEGESGESGDYAGAKVTDAESGNTESTETPEEAAVYAWHDIEMLSELDLGDQTDQDLLQNLYIARRFFYSEEETTANPEECAEFWERMTGSSS